MSESEEPSHLRFTSESRSLYVGHLPESTSYYDLCRAAHEFGPLELVRLVPRKKCAFINFLSLESAKQMMTAFPDSALARPEQSPSPDKVLRILGRPVRLSWSETRPLPDDVAREVANGASRSLFVFYGNCIKDGSGVVTVQELAEAFRPFGNIENIVPKPKKSIAFVNMTSISSAIAAFKAANSINDTETEPAEPSSSTPVQKGIFIRGASLIVKYSEDSNSKENYSYARNDPRNQPFSYNLNFGGGVAASPNQMPMNQTSNGFGGVNPGMGMNILTNPVRRPGAANINVNEPQLPPGWMESVDEKTGYRYYYNSQKKVTQWEHPVTGKPSPPVSSPPIQLQNAQQSGFVNPAHQNQAVTPSRAVILQNLPEGVDYARLCTFARQYGMIESVRLHSDKSMAFVNFVDPASAMSLFRQTQVSPLIIDGNPIKVGWAKEVPIKVYLYDAIVQEGANRSLFLRDLDESITEEEIREEFGKLSNGEIESIILRPQEKPFGFVNFIDIISAKKIMDAAKKENGEVQFSSGKSVHVSYVNSKKQFPTTDKLNTNNPQSLSSIQGQNRQMTMGMNPMQNQMGAVFPAAFVSGKPGFARHIMGQPQPPSGSNPSVPCRSVIISGFPADTTMADISNLGASLGPIESVHLVPEKNHAFINFVNHESASKFLQIGKAPNSPGFLVGGQPVRIGFGKSVPLRPEIMAAIQTEGASRSLYIGGDIESEQSLNQQIQNNANIKPEEIESISINGEKQFGFATFASIAAARKVMAAFSEPKKDDGFPTLKFSFVQEKQPQSLQMINMMPLGTPFM